ncbi:MAG: hypothetical protein Ct9H90mP13_10420 [Pseudomonadota bacterium]|nr:MAG: hypothetical protein Ct9H90mP13_10420 [Pseudomonadota bacterium]
MPNTSKLFNESSNFENHYSGGTSSRMGMFSLFYGLPSTYWRVFHDNLKPSLLIQQFDETAMMFRPSVHRDWEVLRYSIGQLLLVSQRLTLSHSAIQK